MKELFTQEQSCFNTMKSKVQPNKKVMVAVSGGSDSIITACLMYNFFLNNKYDLQNLFFIHCNHNVRAGNKKDQEFVSKFFEGTRLIIVKRKNRNKANEGTLRTRRYEEFQKQIEKYHIDQLVFGHNLTDRIETSFLNLLRGANLNGFLAMQTQENHHLLPGVQILRPILEISKSEVLLLCKQKRLPYCTDPTNKDTTTSLRNKLRNKILPSLYKLAHKQTKTTNSYIESMKNIYKQLEETLPKQDINLIPIHQSPHRNAKFAYQRKIAPQDVNKEILLQAMKTIGIAHNISTPLLKEWERFIQENKSGYKYIKDAYLFKSHGKIYIIGAPLLFWKKTIPTTHSIDKLGELNREGKDYKIDKAEYKGKTLRFPQK